MASQILLFVFLEHFMWKMSIFTTINSYLLSHIVFEKSMILQKKMPNKSTPTIFDIHRTKNPMTRGKCGLANHL